jgi:hypothetical protein
VGEAFSAGLGRCVSILLVASRGMVHMRLSVVVRLRRLPFFILAGLVNWRASSLAVRPAMCGLIYVALRATSFTCLRGSLRHRPVRRLYFGCLALCHTACDSHAAQSSAGL